MSCFLCINHGLIQHTKHKIMLHVNSQYSHAPQASILQKLSIDLPDYVIVDTCVAFISIIVNALSLKFYSHKRVTCFCGKYSFQIKLVPHIFCPMSFFIGIMSIHYVHIKSSSSQHDFLSNSVHTGSSPQILMYPQVIQYPVTFPYSLVSADIPLSCKSVQKFLNHPSSGYPP